MRIIIAGSRTIKDEEAISLIDEAVKNSGWTIDEVISGDAPGVDTAAIQWAERNFIDYVRIPANWKKYNKAAGYKRNQKMAWYAQAVAKQLELQEKEVDSKYQPGLIAIWNGKSKGTGHMIDIANEAGMEVFIWPPKTSSDQKSLVSPE